MSKGVIVTPANRGVQVVVTDEQNVQLLVDGNRNINLEVVPQARTEVIIDKGVQGAPGAGVATGGATGQLLAKASDANYDTEWVNPFDPASPGDIGSVTPAEGTFTQVAVTTATSSSAFNENNTITGWVYSGNSFSVSAQETAPTGLFIDPSGTNMYIIGSSGDDVNQYTLGTAWNITTSTFVTSFSVSAQDTGAQDVFFKPDGLTMIVMGGTTDTVYEYTLSTAWDISTASYASKSFSVTAQETAPLGIWFKSDGTEMYVVGSTSDSVFQYTLSTAWDVSTASYLGIFYSFAAQESVANQVNLSSDGLKMWIVGTAGDDIWEYSLGTAWDVSTATPVNNVYIGFQAISPTGMFIDDSAANRVFISDSSADSVFQYNTVANSLKLDTEKFYVAGTMSVNGNFVAGANANVDGNFTVGGTSNFASINATGLTSSSTTTLATSTSSQTVGIGAVATGSGSTKIMNIGTAGVSGSTTTISIGSAVAGATSTTTLNGLTINSISAAVSAAGTTQATATALVANINNVTVVSSTADGVRLPTAVAGMRILVRNSDAADTLEIYPATGGTINALAVNASFSLPIATTVELIAMTATQWYSV